MPLECDFHGQNQSSKTVGGGRSLRISHTVELVVLGMI